MRVAFITRSTLYKVPGGDTVQVSHTAKFLRELGAEIDVCLTSDPIDYSRYDLFHYFNIIRPSDILFHIKKSNKPFVVSPILIDYSEYDRHHRKGISGLLLRSLSSNGQEYTKTVARWLANKDKMKSKSYLLKGQRRSIRQILEHAAVVLPNSETEYTKVEEWFGVKKEYKVVPMGVDSNLFSSGETHTKDDTVVLCAARIEGVKNQLNLIRALNNTKYTLLLVGSPAPNQKSYYHECQKIAANNVHFRDHVPQETLVSFYRQAKVHALPSWFETCGLSSLEAAAMGCNITITEKGYTREYFGNDAFYCDPGSPESIFHGIENAANSACQTGLQQKILLNYTWQTAARITSEAYNKIISS